MTRQEMNDIILEQFQNEIVDMPDWQERVADSFGRWVQGLIAQGQDTLTPQPVTPAAAQAQESESEGPAAEEVA